jgi:2-aminoadipate transaminase
MGGGANPFAAQIVAEYWHSDSWEQHIKYLRSLYQTRRDAMLAALETHMPTDVRWTHPSGGFFIWLTLPEQILAQQVKRQAEQDGVLVAAGESFFVDPVDGAHHLRLTYSCALPDDIERGIALLARAIERARTHAE